MRTHGMLQLIAGVVLTALIQGALYMLWRSTEFLFAAKFVDRGLIPYACVFLTAWGGVALLEREVVVQRRRKLLTLDYTSVTDPAMSLGMVANRIRNQGKQNKDEVVAPRLADALNQFEASQDVDVAKSSLRAASDAYFYSSQSNYTLIRVFLWTIPILGFIGTVIGVGGAVGGFAQFLSVEQIEAVDEIKVALTSVTSQLGVAFDTTFVGLLLSVILMFWYSLTDKRERDQLQAIETRCDHVVFQLLSGRPRADRSAEIANAIRTALLELVPGIEMWKAQAEALSRAMAGKLLEAWQTSTEKWLAGMASFASHHEKLIVDLVKHSQATQASVDKVEQGVARSVTALKDTTQSHAETLRKVIEAEHNALKSALTAYRRDAEQAIDRQQKQIQVSVSELSEAAKRVEKLVDLQNRLEKDLLNAAGSDGLTATMRDVHTLLESLDPALRRLTEKPLEVEVKFMAAPGGSAGG